MTQMAGPAGPKRFAIAATRLFAPTRHFPVPLNDPELFTDNPANHSKIADPTLTALANKQQVEMDEKKRKEIFFDIQRENAKHMYYVPSQAGAGTRWVGYSDLTALQLGLLAHAGGITWSGPLACDDFGRDEAAGGVDEVTRDCFVEAMDGSLEAVGFRTEALFRNHVRDRQGNFTSRRCSVMMWENTGANRCLRYIRGDGAHRKIRRSRVHKSSPCTKRPSKYVATTRVLDKRLGSTSNKC